jgi:hypothetical protein
MMFDVFRVLGRGKNAIPSKSQSLIVSQCSRVSLTLAPT